MARTGHSEIRIRRKGPEWEGLGCFWNSFKKCLKFYIYAFHMFGRQLLLVWITRFLHGADMALQRDSDEISDRACAYFAERASCSFAIKAKKGIFEPPFSAAYSPTTPLSLLGIQWPQTENTALRNRKRQHGRSWTQKSVLELYRLVGASIHSHSEVPDKVW